MPVLLGGGTPLISTGAPRSPLILTAIEHIPAESSICSMRSNTRLADNGAAFAALSVHSLLITPPHAVYGG